MKHKLFLLPAMLAAAFASSNAALITLIPERLGADGAYPGFRTFVSTVEGGNVIIDEDVDLIDDLPAIGSVSSTIANASSSLRYRTTPSQFSASWAGETRNAYGTGYESFCKFIPTKDLRYELEGSYTGFLAPAEDDPFFSVRNASFFTSLFVFPGAQEGGFNLFFDSKQIYVDSSPLPFEHSFSSSGILPAGSVIGFIEQAQFGLSTSTGSGSWTLKLSSAHVPDGGSTLAMLGMA
jgi:hypothetical protein